MSREPPPHYQSYIVSFMTFRDSFPYPKTQLFTKRQLSKVIPDEIVSWILSTILGITSIIDYVEGMAFRKRSSTIAVMKKAISWYMPDGMKAWDTITMTGNPTKSAAVNDIIKWIKKHEEPRLEYPLTEQDTMKKRKVTAKKNVLPLSVQAVGITGGTGVDNSINLQIIQMLEQLQQQVSNLNKNVINVQKETRTFQKMVTVRLNQLNNSVNLLIKKHNINYNNYNNNNNSSDTSNNNNNNNNDTNNNNDNTIDNNRIFYNLGEVPERDRVVLRLGKPRTLYELWDEYTIGLDGQKPAKDWTAWERGKDKSRYCRRKAFWNVVSQHVRAGIHHLVAIDRIKVSYGKDLPVSEILKRMAIDQKRGGHENLRV